MTLARPFASAVCYRAVSSDGRASLSGPSRGRVRYSKGLGSAVRQADDSDDGDSDGDGADESEGGGRYKCVCGKVCRNGGGLGKHQKHCQFIHGVPFDDGSGEENEEEDEEEVEGVRIVARSKLKGGERQEGGGGSEGSGKASRGNKQVDEGNNRAGGGAWFLYKCKNCGKTCNNPGGFAKHQKSCNLRFPDAPAAPGDANRVEAVDEEKDEIDDFMIVASSNQIPAMSTPGSHAARAAARFTEAKKNAGEGQCEKNPLCIRGSKHNGRGGRCSVPK